MTVGGNASFSVTATGTGPFTYQWQFNGAALPHSTGTITTVAGNGVAGFADQSGLATNLSLYSPRGVVVDGSGNLFIADQQDDLVQEVKPTGIMMPYAGRYTDFGFPFGVALDASGDLFVSVLNSEYVYEESTNGILTMVAGINAQGANGDGGPAIDAEISAPQGLAVDNSGNLFIADSGNNRIRKVDTSGIITTVVGNGAAAYSGDGGQAVNASLSTPNGVTVDAFGNLFIADTGNNVIREVDTRGIITTVVGNNTAGYSGDGGPATQAELNSPSETSLDADGNLFIADAGNNRIREVDGNGMVTTVAGDGVQGYSGDGGAATNAGLWFPWGVALDGSGDLFIGDTGNQRVRKVVLPETRTFTINNLSASNAGLYTVVVSNPYQSVTSSVAILQVTSLSIISQPQNQTEPQGNTANFSVSAIGIQPLSYQWFVNQTIIPSATNSTLSLTNVQPALSGNSYSVEVSNSAGSTNSSAAILTVTGPFCVPSPSGIVSWWKAEGDAADVIGDNNGTLLGGAGFAAGEVGQAFDFRNGTGYVQVPDSPNLNFGANDFTIELWANFPSLSVNRALMAKDNGSGQNNKWIFWINGGQLQFLIGTGASSVSLGTGAFSPALDTWHHLAVTRGGSLFSFYLDGTLISTGSSGTPIPAITAPLTIGEAEGGFFMGGLEDEVTLYSRALSANEIQGIYTAGAAGKCPAPPTIVSQPVGQSVYAGFSASFSVTAGGGQPLTYQWQFGGTNISTNLNPSAATATLSLTSVQPAQAGAYSVVVSNPGGNTNSTLAMLNVLAAGSCLPPPSGITSWWAAEGNPMDIENLNNGSLQGGAGFTAGEVGAAFDFENGTGYVSVPDSPSLDFGGNDFSIELWANFTSLAGSRALIAKDNGPGANNKWIFWLNGGQLQFLIQTGATGVSLGTAAFNPALNTWHHLAVTRGGSSFSFYVDGVLVSTGSSSTPIPAVTAPLTIGEAENALFMGGLEDEVTVYSRALGANEIQNIYEAGTAGKCGPPMPPFVITQPQSQTAFSGQTVTFSALAGGSSPLSYQWQFNGTNISNATGTALTLANLQTSQSGAYSVLVSNASGSTNSIPAQLSVLLPGSCVPLTGVISWWMGEGNALDYVGGNNGVLEGSAGFAPGEVGQAFAFTNGPGYVQVSDSPGLNFGANNFSIELWANFASAGGSQALMAKDNGPGANNKWIFWLNGGQLQFLIQTGATGVSLGTAAFNPAPNTWHHLAVTRSGSLFSLYADGALVSTGSSSTPIPAISAPLTIGEAEGGNFMEGLEDEVTIYSRTLSTTEVQTIYQFGAAGKCAAAGPPVVFAQPASLTAYAGITATFSAQAASLSPLTYQWQLNGTNIPTPTNLPGTPSTLILTNLQASQAGNYSVLVSNSFGSTYSSNAMLTVLQPGDCLPPDSSVISWWPAEGTANDLETNNQGTLEDGASFAAGEVGVAFDFRNGSGYVQVPDSPSLDFGANDFTIELWANFTSSSGNRVLIGKDNGPGQNNKWLFWLSNGQLQFVVQTTSSTPTLVSGGTYNPALNTWHHYAIKRAGTQVTIYVDGAIFTTASFNSAIPPISAPLTIGEAEGGNFMGGLEDEVTIYGRALADGEIQSIYDAGPAGKCSPPMQPVIALQPQNQTAFASQAATFSVLAGGSRPLSYQWQFNGTNISPVANATAANATLELTDVQEDQSGNYSVIVSNDNGTTNSISAQLTVNPLPPCLTPPPGIVGWWTGDGNALDVSGTNDGVLEGGATYSPGEVGLAFDFTDGTGYVQVPDSPSLDLGTGDFSIELWANFTSLTGSRALIAKDNGPGANNKWIFWLTGGELQFFVQTGSSSFGVSAPFSPALNTWHHLVVTRGNTFYSFFVDGVQQGGGVSGGPLPAISGPLTIGEAENTFFMGGLEDEVTVYNQALSAAEIQGIYNASAAGKCQASPPVVATQPAAQLVYSGTSVNFSVLAGGTPPLAYQWQLNGTNISDVTNPTAGTSTLILTNVQAVQAGNYSVLVSNGAGSTNSAGAALTVLAPGSCAPPPANIVSWWQAEGTANDLEMNNPGTLEGGAGFAAGEVGAAFDLRNGTGYVSVPDSPSLDFGGNDFSIELWANFTSLTGSRALIAKDNGPQANNKWIFWLNGGQLQFLIQTGASGVSLGTAAFNPALNTWHHLAVTRGGSLFSFYVDGILVSTGSSSTPIPAITAPLTIGESENGFFMGGLEDEVTIYSRALGANEIQNIYEAGSAGKCAPPTPPVIITQPQGQTVFLGATVTLNVTAGGSPPLSYQWQLNGTNVPNPVGLTNVNSPGTLVLTDVQLDQAGNYNVIVSNGDGSTNSIPALVTVNTAECVAASPTIAGWWAAEGNALDSAGTNHGVLVNGVRFAPGLVGEAFDLVSNSQYVDVRDAASLDPTTNLTVEAWVNPLASISSPVIKKAGVGGGGANGYTLEVDAPGGVLFGVYVNGAWVTTAQSPVPLNQWTHVAGVYDGTNLNLYVNGALTGTPVHAPGTITPSTNHLQIGHDPSNPNRYFLGLIDEATVYDSALSAAQILAIYNANYAGKCPIPLPPSIATQPQSQAVLQGSNAAFSVFVGGTQPFGYQWQFNQQNIFGANGASLVVTNVQAPDVGAYSVIITNALGSTNSVNANLTVLFPPFITSESRGELARPGCTITFDSVVTGTSPLAYQWQFNGTNLPSQTNLSLTIVGVQSNNFGGYVMIASNTYGTATSTVAVLALDHLPVPGNIVVQRFPGAGVRMDMSDLLAGATDADGDPLSIAGVAGTSILGGTITVTGPSIYYLPPAGLSGSDAFTYTISDGHCEGTSVGAVLVNVRTDTNTASHAAIYEMPDGSVQVIFDGMPGVDYRIQSADTLTPPDWQDVTNLTADQYGTYTYTDWPATNGPVRFFRSVTP